MATYLQGITGYVPQIQPFQPDLNFYKGVMDVKESQYKAGYDKISNMYGQLLNSELTRDVNNERRAKFFEQITGDIEKMAGVDLSLEQNVDAAYQIFQPLIDDKNIIKDMAWTKTYNREYQRSESFRNCVDEKKCGGKWWEDGVRALQYQKMDFAKASDEEALGMINPKYTPYVNVTEKATKLAKEMGFNVQSVTWSPDGKYIVTTKNGPAMTMSLNNYFNSIFANDPQIQEVYKTKAYLQRKDYAYSAAEEHGSVEAAEQVYLRNALEGIQKQQEELKRLAQDEADQINLKMGITQDKVDKGEVDPDDPDDVIAKAYQQLLEENGAINSVIDQHDNTLSLIDKSTLLGADIETLRWRVDQAVAGTLLNNELYNAAESYAMLNMEQKIEADPYAKASFENSLAMGRMAMQHEYNKMMVDYKVAAGLVEDSYGFGGGKGSGKISKQDYLAGRYGNILNQQATSFGNNNPTSYRPVDALPGSTAEKNLYESDITESNIYAQGTDQISQDYLGGVYEELTGIMRTKPGSKEAKLAANTLTNIIGQDNIKFAMDHGILDKNFNILDKVQFSQFVENNRDKLMAATDKGYTENFMYLYNMNDQNNLKKKVDFDNAKLAYDQLSQLETIYENKNKQFASEIKNTFMSNITDAPKDSWLNKAGRFAEKWGWFIPNPFMAGIAINKGIKALTGNNDKYTTDIVSDAIYNNITGPNIKDKKLFINELFEKDGYTLKSKDQFINDTFSTYKQNTNWLKSRLNTAGNESVGSRILEGTLGSAIGGWRNIIDILHVSDKEVNNYLGRVYDDMAKQYKQEYASGRLAAYNQGTHTYKQPLESIVDGADFTNPVFGDFVSIMNNYHDVQDDENVKIMRGLGVTGADFTKANKQDKLALDLYHYLSTDMMNTTFTFNDKERPIVRMINQGVAANNPNMTAYTFQVNQDYLNANKGSDKKPGGLASLFNSDGSLKKNADTFTIYIPKDKANNSFIAKTQKGPWQTLYDETGAVNIKLKNVADINIKRQGNIPVYSINWQIFNVNTGKYETLEMTEGMYNEGTDMDSWLRNIYNESTYTNLLYANLASEIEYKNKKKS
jgi:hypothetical protein